MAPLDNPYLLACRPLEKGIAARPEISKRLLKRVDKKHTWMPGSPDTTSLMSLAAPEDPWIFMTYTASLSSAANLPCKSAS